jgi:dihydroflavonol-4-reductase
MKILITGATGFLGSWVARALVRAGHALRALVRATSPRDSLAGLPIEAVEGDILDQHALARAMRGVEAVVHCAGLVSLRPRDREALHQMNVVGSRHVLEVAGAQGLRVVFTSSIATIGGAYTPALRDERAWLGGHGPRCGYVESKRVSEELALSLAARGQDVVVLNPGNALGPGDLRFTSTRLVLQYLRGELRFYLPGGMSFCDVRDVAGAYAAALTRGRSGERYILAGMNLTYEEFFMELWRLTGLHWPWPVPRLLAQGLAYWSESAAAFAEHPFEELNLSVVSHGQMFTFANVSKAMRELGYQVRDFRCTLRDTLADHLSRGAAPRRVSPAGAGARSLSPLEAAASAGGRC